MQVGIIAPIKFLEDYCITSIHYVLPKLLIEEEEYRNFYIEKEKEGNSIILDCRYLGWKRVPEDLVVVLESLKLIEPSSIVLPSEMYNPTETLRVATIFMGALEMYRSKLVPCLEGTSEDEVLELRRGFESKNFEIFAIPSHIYRVYKGSKEESHIYLDNYSNTEELDNYKGILVSSLPIRLGLAGRLLSQPLPTPLTLTFKEEVDEFPMITKTNVNDFINFYRRD